MGSIKFDFTGDNRNVLNAMQGIQNGVRQTSKVVEQQGTSVERMFERVKNAANIAIAGISLKSLTDKIVQTRGEFQQLEVAFQTMLGSQQKASTLMNQLVKTAATTPFDLKGVANGAKQLLAYGTAADDVNSTLIKLGNIAAGLSLNLNDLVWLYGTTMTQGRMFTMDLRQFMGRGIPMAEAIAKVLGTTKDKVAGLVSQGKVTSDVVKKAIDEMSTGSGKFAGLMEAQSRTITGQISNIEDAIDMMFNDIGKGQEGIINGVLSTVSWMIDHYKEIGSVVLTAAAAWGEYKASLMLVAAAQQSMQKQKDSIEATRQAGLQGILDNANASGDSAETTASAAATNADTAARRENKTAIDEQIAALQQSLATKVAEAQADYNSATSAAANASLYVDEINDKVASAKEAYEAALQSGNAEKIDAAETELNTAQAEANSAAKDLQTKRAAAHTASEALETAKTKEQTVATQVDTANKQANTAATGILAAVTRSATAAFQSMKAALISNPFTALLMGVTTIIGLLPLFTSETEEASGAQQKLRETISDEQGKLEGYMAILQNTSNSTKLYRDTVADFNELAKQYNTTQISVNSSLHAQTDAYKELTKAIKEAATAKILQQASDDAVKGASDAEREAMDNLIDDAKTFSYSTGEVVGTSSAGVVMTAQKTASSIRNITADMWGSISAEVMSKSQDIAAAFRKSQTDGEAYLDKEQTVIENMLRTMGATNEDISAFSGTIRDYLNTSAEGFSDNYDEMLRTQQQLGGLQQSTIDLGYITEENINTYSYEQLQKAAEQVNDKINDISNNTASPKVDDTQLQSLKKLLIDIDNLMPKALTKGSNNDLEERLKQAKATRDSAAYGSATYNKANQDVAKIIAEQRRRSNGLAENQNKVAKSQASAAHKAETQAKKDRKTQLQAAKDQANYQQTLHDQKKQSIRDEVDLEYERRQAVIDAMEDSSAKTLKQAQLDYDKERTSIDRWYEDLKDEKIKKAKELFNANPKNKEKVFNPKSVNTSYTEDEAETRLAKIQAAQEKLFESSKSSLKDEQSGLTDYLKSYGSFQEQKLAIAMDYDDKIADANTEAEKAKLRKDKEKDIASVEANAIQAKIDWSQVFSNVGYIMADELRPMLTQLRSFAQTDNFKKLGADQQKTIIDAMDNIRQMVGTTSDVKWKDLASSVTQYQQAQRQYNAAIAEYAAKEDEIIPQIEKAKDDLSKANKDKNADAAKEANDRLQSLSLELDNAGQKVNSTTANVNKSGTTLAATAKDVTQPVSAIYTFLSTAGISQLADLWSAFDQLRGGIDGLKALKDVGKDASDAGKSISDAATQAGDAAKNSAKELPQTIGNVLQKGGLIAQIIGAILKILDILKEGIGTLISSLIDTVLQAVNGIIKNIISGKFIEQIGGSIITGVGNIIDTVIGGLGSVFSFGKLSSKGPSAWFTNSNAKEVAETTKNLTNTNEALKNAIDNLKDSIDKSGGVKAVSNYQQAYDDQLALNKNTMEILQAQMSYHGSHHSNAKYWNKSIGQSDYDAINATLAQYSADHPTDENIKRTSVQSLSDIYELTPEQMQAISSHNVEIWQKMLDAGKYDKSEYWENYIALAGQLEELTEKINENLTQVSFDSLKENFVSDIMDMTKTASDFSQDFTQMVAKAWTNAAVNDLMSDDLNKFYKQWADKMKAGTLTKSDVDELKKEYDSLAQQALNIRENMTQVTGYTGTDQQNASANGVSEITYDQANSIVGLVTAGNVITQQISENMVVVVTMLTAFNTTASSANATLLEMRNLMVFGNQYLEDTLKYTKSIYTDFTDKLDKMNKTIEKLV